MKESPEVLARMQSAEKLRLWLVNKARRRWPWLEDDLHSKTLEALWRASQRTQHEDGFDSFAATWMRGAIKQVLKGDLPHGWRQRVRAEEGELPVVGDILDFAHYLGQPGRLPACLDDEPDCWDELTSTLTDRQREVLTLHFGYDMGTTEIAERLGIFEQSVRNTIRQAVVRIRKRLEAA